MDSQDPLLAQTQLLFAQHARRHLTTEEARQCQMNVAGALRLLAEWQRATESRDRTPDGTNEGPSEAPTTKLNSQTRPHRLHMQSKNADVDALQLWEEP